MSNDPKTPSDSAALAVVWTGVILAALYFIAQVVRWAVAFA